MVFDFERHAVSAFLDLETMILVLPYVPAQPTSPRVMLEWSVQKTSAAREVDLGVGYWNPWTRGQVLIGYII
jgi:hypothetical protein